MHKCSPCQSEFATEEEYLVHPCQKASGAPPTSPDFLILTTTPNFAAIADAALARTAKEV